MASQSVTITDYTKLPGKIHDDGMAYLFPQINSVNSHGKTMMWRIIVKAFEARPDVFMPLPEQFIKFDPNFLKNEKLINIHGYIYVESGIVGGKIKTIVPTIVSKGLNIGKANETNAICQALRDALSKYNKQLRKAKNVSAGLGQTERYPPMLAQVLEDQNSLDFTKSVYIQPKFNGLRAVMTLDKVDGEEICIAYSRTKLLYPGFDYIKKELLPILKEYHSANRKLYLDGELYKHGMRLQDLSGLSRREEKDDKVLENRINFQIYDCFISNEPDLKFSDRLSILNEIFDTLETTYCKQTQTWIVSNVGELREHYKSFIDAGYEGAMVRLDSPYVYSYNSHHSKVLLKLKPSFDGEYEIIGWDVGKKGKGAGALLLKVKTKDGKEFNVTPALGEDSNTERIRLAKDMAIVEENQKTHFENKFLGKMLIVEYDEKSKDDVPQRARTQLVIRDWD